MEERTINRGEVWWVSVDDSIGGEQQTGRPVLVLSNDSLNQKHGAYVVAYLTSSGMPESCRVPVRLNRYTSRVICNQIRTLDKSRFTQYKGTLTKEEMSRVAGAVAGVMCIPLASEQEPPVVADVDDSELLEVQMELAMYKRMYKKTLDQLVDLRIERDMQKRMAVEEPEVEEPEVFEEVEPEIVPEPPKILRKEVELNTCEIEDLMDMGVNEDVATRLIEGRPWKQVEDIRTVDGLTSMMYAVLSQVVRVEEPAACEDYTWDEFKKLPMSKQKEYLDYHRNELGEKESEIAEMMGTKVQMLYNWTHKYPELQRGGQPKRKVEVKPEVVIHESVMVNINTATADELMNKLGMAKHYAYKITGHRNKHGLFTEVEELLLVDKFSKKQYEKYRAHFTVVDEVEEPEEPKKSPEITPAPVVKCNVNTASPFELQQAGFTKKQSFHIVHSRKNKGPFYDIDELSNVDGIKKKDIRKLRDVLEV